MGSHDGRQHHAGPHMKHKINLAMPVYGSVFRAEFTRSLYTALTDKRLADLSFVFSEIDYSDLAVSRNYLLSNFFFNKKDCSHILMVDSDMGFSPDLIPAMLALSKPVVGVLYPKRIIDLQKLHSLSDLPFEKALARSLEFVGAIHETRQTSGSFVRMDWCGGGILLISRACVEQMIAKLPEIMDQTDFLAHPFAPRFKAFLTPFDKIKASQKELSEDLSFCHRWTEQCEGEIWACYDRKISHVGSLTVVAAYSDL